MGKRPKPDHHPHQLAVDVDAPSTLKPAHKLSREFAVPAHQNPSEVAMAPGPWVPHVTSVGVMGRVGEEEETGGAGENAASAANQSLNPVGMQIYWNLSSLNMAVREAAALALVDELRAKQEEFVGGGGQGSVSEVLGAKENDDLLEGCAPGVQYALRRLVRGLGSSRECARQGFATALTAVITALPVLQGKALLQIIPSNLEVTSSMKKQDARDGLLGRLFAYGSLVRSKRLIGNGSSSEEKELITEIVQQLLSLAKQKTFLREPAVNLVLDLASRLPSSAVRETVCAAPLFEEWLRRDLESQSADALVLVLQLYDKLPSQSSPLLPESGKLQDFFDASHLAKLVPCLKESSSSHPRVHSVWNLLLDRLFSLSGIQESSKKKRAKSSSSKDTKDSKKVEEALKNIWSVVVDGALLPSSHERKNLAMELVLLVLPKLPNPETAGVVLSNVFVRCILDILSSKDTHLYKSAQRCLGEVLLWAESSNTRRVAVIGALQKNSYGKFDTLSKSSTVKTLTNGLITEDGVLAFVHNLQELFVVTESSFVKTPKTSEDPTKLSEDALMNGHDNPGANDRIWIIEQMCALCRQVKLEPKAQEILYKEVIKFLVTHSLFQANHEQNGGGIEKNSNRWPQKPLTPNIRKLCVERLHSILVDAEHWTSSQKSRTNKPSASGATDALKEDELFSLYAALHCLSMHVSSAAVLVQPLKEESAESVKMLQQTVSTISSAVKSDTATDKLRRLLAMRILLSNLLLESFLEPGSTDDIAAELAICCSRAFPDLPELAKIAPQLEEGEDNEEVPPVMDVLLDVLLSLLAKLSTPVRNAVEQVFKVYCEDLTSSGMTDILRIINKGSKSGRHRSMLDEDEEDSEDDDILEDDEDDEVDGNVGKVEASQEAKEEEEGEDDDEDDEDDEDDDDGDDDDEAGDEEKDVEMGDGDAETRTLQQQMRFKRPGEDLDDEAEGSDSDISDMDDEAMFRADVLLANVLKHRKEANKNTAQTQLTHFKFRVLSLLEHFLQKHPSSPLVLLAAEGLVKAFVVAMNQLGTAPEENEVLVKRLESMLQGKVLHTKKYPKGKEVDLPLARSLLMKTLKLASRSSIKRVRVLAQACTLWTFKVLLGNITDAEEKCDSETLELLFSALEDYFTHKKSRLAGSFFTELFRRFPVLGRCSIGNLIEKCGNGRTEFMKCEAMRLITEILKPFTSAKGKKTVSESDHHKLLAKAFEEHMGLRGSSILSTVQNPPERAAYKFIALQFCSSCIDAFRMICPQKGLHTFLDIEALLAGLKVIDAPSKGKLRNLITKLVKVVTDELAKNSVRSGPTKGDGNKTSKKKSKVADAPMGIENIGTPSKNKGKNLKEERTPSKRKIARDGQAPVEVTVEETPSKKKNKSPSSKKARVLKGS